MKNTLVRLMLAGFLATSLGGCFFVSKKQNHGHSSAKKGGCKPSQHMENGRCIHNGKGKGARKHDGR